MTISQFACRTTATHSKEVMRSDANFVESLFREDFRGGSAGKSGSLMIVLEFVYSRASTASAAFLSRKSAQIPQVLGPTMSKGHLLRLP